MVDFDFAAKSYAKNGLAVAFDDIFTYTRASSATFTNRRLKKNGGYEYFLDNDYVGSVTNLLKYSEDFSDTTLWATNGAIITNAAIAPDGTLSADHLQETSISSAHGKFQGFDITAGTYTRSIYAKAAERSWFYVKQYDGVSNSGAWFNLTAGTVGTVQAGMTAAMEPAGDGWFKCSITNTTSASTERAQYGVATNNGAFSYVGTTGLGVYIWGAQFTESTKPLPYVKTLDVAVTKTFAETLRTEYDAVTGENLGALIEGGSTNLCTGSEDLSLSASWSIVRTALTINASIAPDGTFSADKIAPLTTNQPHYIMISQTTIVSPSKAAISFYVKPAGYNFFQIGSGQTSSEFATFDLQSGTISETGSATNESDCSIKPAGNGFYRVSVSLQPSNSGSTFSGAQPSGALGWQPVFAGNGTSGVYVWGAQFEALPFATSYIRTEGAAVSRSSDNLNLPSAGNFDADEYSVTSKINTSNYFSSSVSVLTISGGSNRTQLDINGGNFRPFSLSGGAFNSFSGGSIPLGDTVNLTLTFSNGTLKGYFNDDLKGQFAIPTMDPVSIINIGNLTGNSQRYYGHISKLSTYAQALTAQEITLL